MTERNLAPWPELPLAAWRGTRETLHMWTQIVGKTLLEHSPARNHWWHAALHVTARGLGSGRLAEGELAFDVELDLVEHRLVVRTSDGRSAAMALAARTVRSFYEEYVTLLGDLGIDVRIWTRPVEVARPIPFDLDDVHREYDPASARRFFEALRRCDDALEEVAAGWVGKQSPVQFFWGSFDLALTRFSGRRAPPRPGADRVTREAYSHEVISFGFWPGGATPGGVEVDEPVLYAYAAPEPEGFRDAEIAPAGVRYDARLGEFLLPYDAVRAAPDPRATIREFCDTAYAAGATLGGWDRAALERTPSVEAGGPGAEAHDAVHPTGP